MPAARKTEPPGAGIILRAHEDVRSMIPDFSRRCLARLPLVFNCASSGPDMVLRRETK